MAIDVDTIKVALADLSNNELRALIWAANNSPQVTPGLLTWVQAACTWEFHRRVGVDHELESPGAVIPPGEATTSIDAANAIKSTFGKSAGGVRVLLETLIEAIGFIALPQPACETAPGHSWRQTCIPLRST